MTNKDTIRKFEYRPSRTTASFDVEFVAGGKTLFGVCEDVSDEGIRARINGSVDVGSVGVVVFRHSTGVLELEAQVAYVEMSHVGLVFLFQSVWERKMVNTLIAQVQKSGTEAQVVPFR